MRMCVTIACLVLGSLSAAAAASPAAGPPDPTTTPTFTARTVRVSRRDIVPVAAKLRYTTLILLPAGEQILDVTCGDKDRWVINGAQNVAYVKPATAGASTNVNLVTASGNVYSFVVTDVSEQSDAVPDLKLFVELAEDTAEASVIDAPRFVSAAQVDDWRQQAELARAETRQAHADADEAIARFRGTYASTLKFTYQFKAHTKPFLVHAIYHDNRFTYIQATPSELPALYELHDGQPSLVSFEVHGGVYIVGKVLDRGYLQLGAQQLAFGRQE